MSAQPIHQEPNPWDPEVILRHLPQGEHAIFLQEYREAAEAATRDPAEFKALRALLTRWSLVADVLNEPGYGEALAAAKAGHTPGLSLEQVDELRRSSR